jgi:hypothetical protein
MPTNNIHLIIPVKPAPATNPRRRPRIITAISETNISSIDIIQNEGDKTFIIALSPPMTGTTHTLVLLPTTDFVGALIEALQTIYSQQQAHSPKRGTCRTTPARNA